MQQTAREHRPRLERDGEECYDRKRRILRDNPAAELPEVREASQRVPATTVCQRPAGTI